MTATLALLGALINLTGPGHFIDWGFIQISVANFVLICLMVLVFIAAILLPLPSRRHHHDE
jgi:high-affinity Fe2+/Pb2+ permease